MKKRIRSAKRQDNDVGREKKHFSRGGKGGEWERGKRSAREKVSITLDTVKEDELLRKGRPKKGENGGGGGISW